MNLREKLLAFTYLFILYVFCFRPEMESTHLWPVYRRPLSLRKNREILSRFFLREGGRLYTCYHLLFLAVCGHCQIQHRQWTLR